MSRRRLLASALVLLLAAASARAGFGTESVVELPRGLRLEATQLVDFDGDGRRDLLVTASRRGGWLQRSLRVHLRGAGKGPVFDPTPDHELELPEDVVAVTTRDVDERRGADVVLLTPVAAYLWRPDADEAARFERLLACELLWQLPDRRSVFFWNPPERDLDGDGRDDLLIPEPDGYRIAFGAAKSAPDARLRSVARLAVPTHDEPEVLGRRAGRARGRRARNELRVRFGVGDDSRSGPFLVLDEQVPAPVLIDYDGDGDLDVMAQTPKHVLVWPQTDGTFPERPVRQATPVVADRRRRLDVSYSSHAAQLDGDRRADVVVLAGNQRSEDVRTQVLVFLHGVGKGDDAKTADEPLFGPSGRPQQLLVLAGFAGAPQLVDVDGDGARDLVVGSLEVDTLDTIQAAASGELDAELSVFLNRRGQFSRTPDLRHTITLAAEGLRGVRDGVTAVFPGDVTRDGVSELLVRTPDDDLRLLMVRSAGGELTVVDRPLWSTRLGEDTDVAVDDADEVPELLLTSRGRVTHVRFR